MSNFDRLKNNKLLFDSFLSVFGNGLGHALFLLAGIVIARFLGNDLYGQYGMVKTTMFYIASFATLGLNYSSTKFVAQSFVNNIQDVFVIIKDAFQITLVFSLILALFLIIFADALAVYLGDETVATPLRYLSFIILFKALSGTQLGILGGLKKYDYVAKSNVYSGILMFVACIPLTFLWGLIGSLICILISQLFSVALNTLYIHKECEKLPVQAKNVSHKKELIKFSIPIAIHESSYAICNWAGLFLLTKLSSFGELGIFTATSQWNIIIMFIPSYLTNVILSYLSSSSENEELHKKTFRRMIIISFICTFIPFVVVFCSAEVISNFYGPSFAEMPSVLRLIIFATLFDCLSNVFKSEFISMNLAWSLSLLRILRDIILVFIAILLLVYYDGESGAFKYAVATIFASILYFVGLLSVYLFKRVK